MGEFQNKVKMHGGALGISTVYVAAMVVFLFVGIKAEINKKMHENNSGQVLGQNDTSNNESDDNKITRRPDRTADSTAGQGEDEQVDLTFMVRPETTGGTDVDNVSNLPSVPANQNTAPGATAPTPQPAPEQPATQPPAT